MNRRSGSHHRALRLSRDLAAACAHGQLHAVAERIDAARREENGGPLIVFRDRDNIQLEVWAFERDQVKMNQE